MKYVFLLLTLLSLTACGKSGGSPQAKTTNPTPTPSPTPSPTPDPFIGTWRGQDWSLANDDTVILNSNGTGSLTNCSWTFNWAYANPVTNPNTLIFSNITSPHTGDLSPCDPKGTPKNIPYNWLNSNAVVLTVWNNNTFTYTRQ